MIRFPEGFVQTRWPGYFWFVPDQKLYSIKSGTLKELKRHSKLWTDWGNGPRIKGNRANYQLSVNGKSRTILVDYLIKQYGATDSVQTLEYKPRKET